MNELLREIAVKAQVEHCISHVRLQEFADLIVKECGVALNPPVQNRNVISIDNYTMRPGRDCVWVSYGLVNCYYRIHNGRIVDVQFD